MNKSWQEERKEIAIWLSGYLGMVKKWVDKILDNEDHEVDKNKIINTLSSWIDYLSEERKKIMMLKNSPTEKIKTNEYGDDDWATLQRDE